MKFYYGERLIRTSKNHIYTHAVINKEGQLYGCRTSREAAQAIITTEINRADQTVRNLEEMLKALKSGKGGYFAKDGRKTYYVKFDDKNFFNVERKERALEDAKSWAEKVRNHFEIVELEAR